VKNKTWFRVSRELTEHTKDGRLTTREYAVLVTLTGLADHRTGSYKINAPALRYFLGDLDLQAAQRVLESLADKRYIFRDITPRSTKVCPFYIDGFPITGGAQKGLQLDLTEVFETGDVSKRKYVIRATEDESEDGTEAVTEDEAEGVTEGANKNKKARTKKARTKNQEQRIPITDKGKEEIQKDTGVALSESRKEAKGEPSGKGGATLAPSGCDPGSSPAPLRLLEGSQEAPIPKAQAQVPAPTPPAPTPKRPPQPSARLPIHWVGTREAGEWFHNSNDQPVGWLESKPLIAKAGLEQYGAQFFDLATGDEVPWADAYERITGTIISGRDAA